MATKAIAQDIPRTEADMEAFKKEVRDIITLFGCLLYLPAIILVGVCYGVRAGVIVGLEQTLSMIKRWGK